MSTNRSRTVLLLGIIFALILSTGLAVTLVQADETKVPNNETVRVIDYEFSTKDIPEESTAKVRITVQNTGASDVSGDLVLDSTAIDGATVDIEDQSKTYNIEAGSRQSYIFEITANNSGLNTGDREEVQLNLQLEGETISPWESVHVLPLGSTVSEGTVTPTGDREQINKAFSNFKDNRDANLGSYKSDIPPVEEQSGEFIDTSQGRIFNFLSSAEDDSEATSIETYNDGKINVGVHTKNIPNTNYYTIQANYKFDSANTALDQVEFKVVGEAGREIDTDTTYILSDKNQRETRYFQLSEKEIEFLQQSNNIYVVIENTDINENQEELDLYYLQLISSDQPLTTETPDIRVTDTNIYDEDGNNVISDPEFETGDTINVRYTVENHGNAVGERQIALYENGELSDTKMVEVNPGETKYVNFSFQRESSGIYRYNDPSSTNDIHAYVVGDEDLPPIAAISEPPEPNTYFNGRLIDDPTDSGTEVTLSADNSFSPSGNIVEYRWDADWLSNTVITTSSTVTLPGTTSKGTYNVVLTVVDNNGREDMAQEQLYAGTVPPEPAPLGEVTTNVEEPVEFDASGSTHPDPYRCIVEYRWEDGDGNVLESNTDGSAGDTCVKPTPNDTHVFSEAGTHNVRLIAVDDLGNEGVASRQVHVTAPEPTAKLEVDENEKLTEDTFNFDASGSYDDKGSIVQYSWEMGDGTTYNTTSPQLSHSYTEGGSYNVKVTVENEFGGTDTATVNVNALEQPFDIGIAGDTTGETGDIYQLDNTPTEGRNNVDQWIWEMGDGTTYEGNTVVEHEYAEPGSYNVTLTGTTSDFGGFTDSETLTITVMQAPPVAVINASYESGSSIYVSDAVTFDGSESYDPEGGDLDYHWEMGNSDQVYTQETIDSFQFDETELVEQESTLTVTDPQGLTDTATHTLDITARSPQASFTYTPQNPGPAEPTEFDASTSKHNEPIGEIVEYRWNFHYKGSGTDYTGENITATFPENNTEYDVTLTVEDQWGQTDSTTKTVKTDAYKSCHEFLQERPETESGFYQLDPLETNETIEVYCDMETQGGGWTVIDKESFYNFYQQVGNDLTRDGDIEGWNVGPNNIYSYDGYGDHSFRYYIDTGFEFTQVRTDELTFGSASYKADYYDTSEVRGDNTAIGDKDGGWAELNSGGVSGEIAIGTKYSIIDSWARERADIRGGDISYWNSSWQWNGQGISGGDGNLVDNPGNFGTINNYNISYYPKNVSGESFDRFHFENETYNKSGKTIGVGWGESGGQWEGWEWKTGSFMLRQPVSPPKYFYNQGNNVENFEENTSLESGSGNISFESDHISMMTIHSGGDRYVTSDPIDLSKYKTIYIGYVLTVEEGGSGYIEMEAGGKTVRDTIDQQYLVNDNSMQLDVSNVTSTSPITIQSHTSNEDTQTTVRVDRVWGQEMDKPENTESKVYTVENPTNKTPTDYPVEINVQRPSEMNTDYGSARFYQNGEQLDYHLVNYNDTEATFMVELDQLQADTTDVTMKYGDNTLSSVSNPEETYTVYDYHGSGMDDGTFEGDASDQGDYALLTPDQGSMRGSLKYGTFNKDIGLKATYDWRHWGSDPSPADSVNFVTYNNGINFDHEDPNTNGLHFSVVDHYTDECVTVNYNGQCDRGSTYNYTYDENWHTATASVAHQYGDTYSYYFDSNAPNAPVFDSQITATTLGNTFGFSARTGGSTNNHAVKDITIRKWIGEPVEVYDSDYTEISGSHYITTTSGSATFTHAQNAGDFDEMFSSDVNNQGYWNKAIYWDDHSEVGAPSNYFGWKYEGYIYAPETGTYQFGIDGDDAVDAYVGGHRVASWYDGHGMDHYYRMGEDIQLEKGWHTLKVRQEEGSGGEGVDFGWNTPSSGTTRVPSEYIAGSPEYVKKDSIDDGSGSVQIDTYENDFSGGHDFNVTSGSINYTGSYVQYDGGFDGLSAEIDTQVDPNPGYHVHFDTYLGNSWSSHSRIYLYDSNGDIITYGGVYHDDYRSWGGGIQLYDGNAQQNWTYQGIPHHTWVTIDYYYDPVNNHCEIVANGVTQTTGCSGSTPPKVDMIRWAGWQHRSGTSIDNLTVEGWSAG